MSYYWTVKMTDGYEYKLSDAQFAVFQKAADADQRMVAFDRFVISLRSVLRVDRHKETKQQLPDHPEVKISEEKRTENMRRLKDVAGDIFGWPK